MGIQDYIDRIDPVTGDKHVKEGMNTPGRDKGPMFMCPHGGGGRNWNPTSYIEATQTPVRRRARRVHRPHADLRPGAALDRG